MKTCTALIAMLTLASCSGPPRPPKADESRRHPANAASEIELQTCKGDLGNIRIQLSEKARDGDRLQERLTAAQSARTSLLTRLEAPRGATYALTFPYGATVVDVAPDDLKALLAQAKDAPLIVVSGRTDGLTETAAESRIARERAEFGRRLLLKADIPAARIRTTWQPIGDHAADNTSAEGRSLNRRVEIEVYRAAPRFAMLLANGDPRHGGPSE